MSTVLALAALSVPAPDMPTSEALYYRVLPSLTANKNFVMVTLNLWVNPDGKIEECTVGKALGDLTLVPTYCPGIIEHTMPSPVDQSGARAYAFVNFTHISYAGQPRPRVAKAAQQILALPNGGDAEGEVHMPDLTTQAAKPYLLQVEIDVNGALTACTQGKRTPENVVGPACALAGQRTYTVRHSATGERVSYVRHLTIVGREGRAGA